MKLINLLKETEFSKDMAHRQVLYDSRNLTLVAFNFEAGQELPVHCLSADSELALLVLEGDGEFQGENAVPVQAGNLMILPVCVPHGLKAHSRVRVLAFISPSVTEY